MNAVVGVPSMRHCFQLFHYTNNITPPNVSVYNGYCHSSMTIGHYMSLKKNLIFDGLPASYNSKNVPLNHCSACGYNAQLNFFLL